MAELTVKVDTHDFDRLTAMFASAGTNIKPALRRAINHTGDKARTQIGRALVKQTGLKYGKIREALHTSRAGSSLTYLIVARDGYVSLKEFAARQTQKGVSAAPWGKRRVFPRTFIVASLGGHVFERKGPGRFPIRKLWGPAIPVEMVKDQTKEAFETTVEAELPGRIDYEIGAILSRRAPG
jgi:hypothetical protein